MLLFWYQGFKIHSLSESGGTCYWQAEAAGCLNPGDWHPPEQQTETLFLKMKLYFILLEPISN